MNDRCTAIGGEIELDIDRIESPETANVSANVPLAIAVATGRTALRMIARTMFKEGRKEVLLPSYLCASIMQPFREESIDFRFYRVTGNLEVDVEDLRRKVDRNVPGAILFIHYFGFPPSPEALSELRLLRKVCWIIEDRAHTSLGGLPEHGPDCVGDFALTSFRKYLPLPDGGFILNRSGSQLPLIPEVEAEWVQKRLRGKLLRSQFLLGGPPELEQQFLALFASAERELDTQSPMIGMSCVSRRLLKRINLADVVDRRRKNFTHLLNAFVADAVFMEIGQPVFPELPDDVSPLIFPIRVHPYRREALRNNLAERRAYCPVHWHWPRELDPNAFPDSAKLSSAILGLPVDQRYDTDTMQDLLGRLSDSWRSII